MNLKQLREWHTADGNWWHRIKRLWRRKESYYVPPVAAFSFQPKADITAFEIAEILYIMQPSICEPEFERMTPDAQRHFQYFCRTETTNG